MTDPELTEQPAIPTKLIVSICICAALSGIAALYVSLEEPPRPYQGLLLLSSLSALVIGASLGLGGLVWLVSQRFGRRYDKTHNTIVEYQERTERRLDDLVRCQHEIATEVKGLVSRSRRLCKQHKDTEETLEKIEAALEETIQSISALGADLDALTAGYIETGHHPGHARSALRAHSERPRPVGTGPGPLPHSENLDTTRIERSSAPSPLVDDDRISHRPDDLFTPVKRNLRPRPQ